VFEHRPRERLAFVVGERELLGEVRENAQTVRTRVDHEIDDPLLAFQIERARFGESGRHYREDAAIAWSAL